MEEDVQQRGAEEEDEGSENNCEALYNAVVAGDVATLQQLLSQGVTPDMFYDDDHNISSKSILHIACGKGRTDCVNALLEASAMADIHDKWGQTPLHYCVCVQFLDTAEALLDHQTTNAADLVNCQDSFGKAPLHVAADAASLPALTLLLGHGADVNVRNFEGVTPLMVCAQAGPRPQAARFMETLMEAGALIDLVDYRGKRSALQRAALSKNVAGVELLLAAGAQVDSLDVSRRTSLTNIMWDHVRYKQGVCQVDSDVMTIIVLLTQAGADLDLSVCEYSNPLVTAAFLQAAPLLRFFLDQGAQPNVVFNSGVTPLLIATSKKSDECVKLLLSHNCHMTLKGRVYRRRLKMEYTFDPVEMALDDGSFDLVRLFLAAGYPISSINNIRCQLVDKLKEEESQSIDGDLRQWLLSRVQNPASLRELTIYTIRSHLDQRLHQAVSDLPLPSRIKDSILLTHLLS